MKALLRVEDCAPQGEFERQQGIQWTADILLTENSGDMTALAQVSLPQDIDWTIAADVSFNPDAFEIFVDHPTVGRYVVDLAHHTVYPAAERAEDSAENEFAEGDENGLMHRKTREEPAPEIIELQEFLGQSTSTVSSPTVAPAAQKEVMTPTPTVPSASNSCPTEITSETSGTGWVKISKGAQADVNTASVPAPAPAPAPAVRDGLSEDILKLRKPLWRRRKQL